MCYVSGRERKEEVEDRSDNKNGVKKGLIDRIEREILIKRVIGKR